MNNEYHNHNHSAHNMDHNTHSETDHSKHKDWSGMKSHIYSASESPPGVSPDDII